MVNIWPFKKKHSTPILVYTPGQKIYYMYGSVHMLGEIVSADLGDGPKIYAETNVPFTLWGVFGQEGKIKWGPLNPYKESTQIKINSNK